MRELKTLLFLGLLLCAGLVQAGEKRTFYVGTLSNATNDADFPPSRGVYRVTMDMDADSAEPAQVTLAFECLGLSFLAKHPALKDVYYGVDGKAIYALKKQVDGSLAELNQHASLGQGACHVSVHPSGKFAFVSNYSDGHAVVFELAEDGSLTGKTWVFAQQGTGPNAARQRGPHAHFMQADPAGKYAICCDLGADSIFSYQYDPSVPAEETWKPNPNRPFATVSSGAGARHAVFAPNGHFVYVVNELSCTVEAFAYDAELGTMTNVQTIASLPLGYHGVNKAAAIAIHPSGKFLYVSNRGADLMTVFAVDDTPVNCAGGEAAVVLQPIQYIASGGEFPRFAGLSEDGTLLFVCNKKTHTLAVFRVDAQTGKLTNTGKTARIAWCCAVEE